MAELFGKELIINIGGTRIASVDAETLAVKPILKVVYKIIRTLTKEPNKADLSIWNLRAETRAKFQEKDIPTIIESGYVNNTSQIFSGNLSFGSSILNGADWITAMQAGDGRKAFKSERVCVSLKGPIGLGDVLLRAGQELGLNLGNLQEKATKGSIRATLKEFAEGIVLNGKAEQVFDRIAKAAGYSWSIQDGQIQLLEPTETIGEEAVLLSESTGLVGSPQAGEGGVLKFRALQQPKLLPGNKVKVVSRDVDAFFRIEKGTYLGDTEGQDWYADLEGKPL